MCGLQVDQSKINEATRFWDETERVIKEAEQISQEMVVPAISELRYAGRKLIDYLTAIAQPQKGRDAEEDIIDFYQCCIRARHDSLDAAVGYIIQYLEGLEQEVQPQIIARTIDDYKGFKETLFEVSGKIIGSRQDRPRRIEVYDDILEQVEGEIFPKFTEIRIAKVDIFSSQASLERRENISSWMTAAASVVMFLGAAAFCLSLWM